jgi:hypothetical protein
VNSLDIAPRHASLILGLSNTAGIHRGHHARCCIIYSHVHKGTIPGIVGVYLTGVRKLAHIPSLVATSGWDIGLVAHGPTAPAAYAHLMVGGMAACSGHLYLWRCLLLLFRNWATSSGLTSRTSRGVPLLSCPKTKFSGGRALLVSVRWLVL